MVLELTLKHVKALTSLLEQQQQKILALQNGMQIGELQIIFAHAQTHEEELDGFSRQNANNADECRIAPLKVTSLTAVYKKSQSILDF